MKKVLFVCNHNSARSQMAEAFLKTMAGEYFEAESAGLEKGNLNPIVVDAMKEIGIDISHNETKRVFDLFLQGRFYTYVIAVCDKANAEACPIFPGQISRIDWSFTDPSSLIGTYEEKLQKVREIRDEIKEKVEEFIIKYKEI